MYLRVRDVFWLMYMKHYVIILLYKYHIKINYYKLRLYEKNKILGGD